MAEQYKSLHPTKYYRDYLNQNIRPDGRNLQEHRPITVNMGAISTADGSAIVKIGHTTVICGIKAELCLPKAETAAEGFFIPNVELPPLCSSKFKPGPPTEQAQIATQLVDDIIRNSKCLNLKDLCIFSDKLAWCLYADLICLDFDGSLIDCCIIALITALKTVTLPQVEYDAALDNKQVNLQDRKSLNIGSIPISSTFAIFENKYFLNDPTIEEEDLSSGLLIIVAKEEELCFVHKPGGTSINEEQLFDCIERSKSQGEEVRKLINVALKDT